MPAFDQAMLQTWEPVSTVLIRWVWGSWVFQNRMVRSAVPPPEARRFDWVGDHAIAFTAAMWEVNVWRGWVVRWSQMSSLLSFPPDARRLDEALYFNPQTSWVCEEEVRVES